MTHGEVSTPTCVKTQPLSNGVRGKGRLRVSKHGFDPVKYLQLDQMSRDNRISRCGRKTKYVLGNLDLDTAYQRMRWARV